MKEGGDHKDVAVDATSIYWHAQGKLLRMCKSSGEPLVIADAPDGWGVAVDDEAIYWTTGEGLMKALK